MKQYKLNLIDAELIELVKKYKTEILNSEKILAGITIFANSEEEARNQANKHYILMVSQELKSSMVLPEIPEINSSKYNNAWLNNNFTSCQLVSSSTE